MQTDRKKLGFTLIEVMTALLILALVSTLVISISLQVTSMLNASKLRNQAVALSEQTLEQARGYYQQNGWAGLTSVYLTTYPTPTCYTDGTFASRIISCGFTGISGTPFSQVVELTALDATQFNVEVTINWDLKGVTQTEQIVTYFYNY
jgi:prepilin-type N-terminal cleavage/methylation domain-containing protein